METIANYFSDETLTFLLLIIPLILTFIGVIPAIKAERQLKEYKAALQKQKQKQKQPEFNPTPNNFIWCIFFIVVAMGIFVGVLKYTKDSHNRYTIADLRESLQTNKDSISTLNGKLSHTDSLIATVNKQLQKTGKVIDKNGGIVQENAGLIYNGDHGSITNSTFYAPGVVKPESKKNQKKQTH